MIFNSDPMKERFQREFDGGVGIVEMLFRCNILALVGSAKNPKYPPHKVMIWDDYQGKCLAELEFRTDVKAVKLRRDRIVVVLEEKIYVYNFLDLQPLHPIETSPNPKGLCALSSSTDNIVLACPCPGPGPENKPGFVRVEHYDIKQTRIFKAHDNALSQLTLNADGTRLATSSAQGTLIRIFDTATGEKLRELRRGAQKAEIYSLAFNATSTMLCVSSDRGTVHVYGATDTQLPQGGSQNSQSSLAFMKDVLPNYFGSEWSFAQLKVPDSTKFISSFGPEKNSIIVVAANGKLYKFTFDGQGAVLSIKSQDFLKTDKKDDEERNRGSQ